MRNLAALVAAVTLLCVAGGCAKPAAPTKAEYVAAANGVCGASKEEAVDLAATWVKDNPTDTGVDGTEQFVRFRLVKHYRNTMSVLRTVPPVPGDASYLDSMYRDFEHSLAVLYSDPLGRSSLDSEQAAEGRFLAYGMTKCASMADDADKGVDAKLKKAYSVAAAKKAATQSASASG